MQGNCSEPVQGLASLDGTSCAADARRSTANNNNEKILNCCSSPTSEQQTRGSPLRRCILCAHTHTRECTYMHTRYYCTKIKNLERIILKTNTSFFNRVLFTIYLVSCIYQCCDHLIVIEHWFVIFIFHSKIRTSWH